MMFLFYKIFFVYSFFIYFIHLFFAEPFNFIICDIFFSLGKKHLKFYITFLSLSCLINSFQCIIYFDSSRKKQQQNKKIKTKQSTPPKKTQNKTKKTQTNPNTN